MSIHHKLLQICERLGDIRFSTFAPREIVGLILGVRCEDHAGAAT